MLTRYCCSRLLGPSFADVKQLTVAPLRNQDQSPANRKPNKSKGKESHNIFLKTLIYNNGSVGTDLAIGPDFLGQEKS